jgi:hypothetical protein
MQHCGWRSAIHRRKISGALLVGVLLATAVIGYWPRGRYRGQRLKSFCTLSKGRRTGRTHGPAWSATRPAICTGLPLTKGGAGGAGVVF